MNPASHRIDASVDCPPSATRTTAYLESLSPREEGAQLRDRQEAMNTRIFFNAHHAPAGAFATFTFGAKGASGGLGLELGGPADESLYVGLEDAKKPGRYQALPFFDMPDVAKAEDFDVEGLGHFHRLGALSAFADSEIERSFGPGIDEWRAADLTFRVATPAPAIPDPDKASDEAMRDALVPAVVVELTVDNRNCPRPRKAFFGYAGSERANAMRVLSEDGLTGVGQGYSTAIATLDKDVYAGVAWQPEAVLEPRSDFNLPFMLGSIGLLVGTVPAGEMRTFRFAVCFYREGTVTTGFPTRYLYRRYFPCIGTVARHALLNADRAFEHAQALDAKIAKALSPQRAFSLAHAIRSYYGSTQCLETSDGKPLWVVNEGEYRMMNTFDLLVDQSFFELALNPWTVRNGLDFYVERYSYEDKVRFPGDPAEHEGGIAFTHDMGVANAFSDAGRSSYEQACLTGCFSFMSCEELVNWILSACLYAHVAGDRAWVQARKPIFEATLRSLMNRDHPDPAQRNGVMGLDSSRCEGGSEITTYDSLDASLGQARNNLYLAVKCWAAYVLLEPLLAELGERDLADQAADQARRCAQTIVSAADEDGLIHAVIGEGVAARIIPAIEGLVFPFVAGRQDAVAKDGPYSELILALERHFEAVLKPGICLFPDGGWKLSSTSRNSWLSKIYLCQFVAENILGKRPDTRADAAHVAWLLREDNAYYAWSDQILEGTAVGSRYYPRGVTGVLWLGTQAESPLCAVRKTLLS